MGRKLTVLGIAALVLLAGTAVASTAFTTATIDRDASVAISDDTGGIIGLSPNADVAGVTTNASGNLQLNLGGNGNGLNNNARFVYGDNSSAASTPAFTLTNNANADQTISLSYALAGSDPAGADNIRFTVYDGSNNVVGTFTEGGNDVQFTATKGTSYYVVIEVDTTGLTNGDSLSGTLTISK